MNIFLDIFFAYLLLLLTALGFICVGYIIYCSINLIYENVRYRPGHIKKARNGKAMWFTIRVLKENKEDEKTALEITKTNKIDYLKFFFNKLKTSLFRTNNDKALLWIPLSVNDSDEIEKAWRNVKHDPLSEISIMNGLFKVNDGFDKLIPIHWEKEKADWLLMRGGYIYEMPFTPPAMYFMNIKPNPDMGSYYQPLNLCPPTAYSFSSTEFPSPEQSTDVLHIIFVIHGIGHHESEEGIVENANDIREGFINYLKKFHSTLPTPIVIPIAWRCDLLMDDKQIQASQSLKSEMAKKTGIIANEPLYYLAEYKDDIKNSLIDKLNSKFNDFQFRNPNQKNVPKVSLLAHSLGSVIAFDILNDKDILDEKKRNKLEFDAEQNALEFDVEYLFLIGSPLARFLINKKFDLNQLKQNFWFKNGKIINMMNPDDPVVHRLETLFNPCYEYVEPLALCLDNSMETSLKQSANDQEKFLEFHTKITDDRELAATHNSLFQIDYCKPGSTSTVSKLQVKSPQIRMKFSEVRVVDSKLFEITERIPHRFDYNLFYSEHRPEIIDFETYSFTWAKKFVFAHSSYWKSQEVIALMTNIMYHPNLEDYIPRTVEDNKNINRRRKILTAFLVVCRLFCTISLVNHTKPLFSVLTQTYIFLFIKGEPKLELNLIYMISFLLLISVFSLLKTSFVEKVESFYSSFFTRQFWGGIVPLYVLFLLVMHCFGWDINYVISVTYNFFLILFAIILPNNHKTVGIIQLFTDVFRKNASKRFIYFLFFLPALADSLFSYLFKSCDFETVFFVFGRTYTYMLIFCSVFQFLMEACLTIIESDELEHVALPAESEEISEKRFRANILCKMDGNNVTYGSITKKRFSQENDDFNRLSSLFCSSSITLLIFHYIFPYPNYFIFLGVVIITSIFHIVFIEFK